MPPVIPKSFPSEPETELRHLVDRFGKAAVLCVGFAAEDRPDDLMKSSVALLELLDRIWEMRDVSPDEVWTELDHRLQLGQLLLRLQQDARRLPRRGKGQWHPGSTKLP